MKKIASLIAAGALFFMSAAAHAVPTMVDFSKMPQDAALTREVKDIAANERMYSVWYADDLWKFPVTKAQAAEPVIAVLGHVESLITGGESGIDLRLYRIMLMHYLYNLDVGDYHKAIMEAAAALKRDFPNDYRPYWILGFHLAHAGLLMDAEAEFRYVIERMPAKKLHPGFWDDYSFVCGALQMPVRAVNATETSMAIRGGGPVDASYYQSFKKDLKPAEGAPDLTSESMLRWEKAGDQYSLMVRPFGMWFPVQESWSINGPTLQGTTCFFKSESEISTRKGTISSTLLMIAEAHPKKSFDEFRAGFLKGGSVKPASFEGIDPRWEVWDITNPSLYPQIGGMHGYVCILSAKEPVVKGYGIEHPYVLPRGEQAGGVSYFAFQPVFLRFDGEIQYAILLDSCEEAIASSREELLTMLRGMEVE